MEFLALRFLVIGAVVVGVILVVFAVAVALKKAGKLGQAKDFVEPIIRSRVAGKGGVKAGLANMVLDRVNKMDEFAKKDPQHPVIEGRSEGKG